MDLVIKNYRINQSGQLKRLDKKCQDECSLLEEIRGYMKKKSEIEAQYHEELNNLSTQYLAKKKPKQEDRAIYKAWYSFLEELANYSKIRGEHSAKIREELVNPMKVDVEEKKKSFTKYNAYGERIQESLSSAYSDLIRAKQIYEQTEKESQKAKTKYEDLQKPPTGTLKKIKFNFADSKKQLETAKKKFKSTGQRAQDARNEYFLALESTNAHQMVYFSRGLPFLMKQIDGNYFDDLRHYLTTFAMDEKENCQKTTQLMDQILSVSSLIDRETDYQNFLNENQTFNPPASFSFEPHNNDSVNTITINEVSKVVLSKKLRNRKIRLDEIEIEIQKKTKELEALKKMTLVYDATPSFGKASETQDELDAILFHIESLESEKLKNEKIISKLTAAGVEVLNPVESASKKSKKKKCIALYDFTAERESDLTIRTDDVIVILEDGDEWIKGELNGAEGFFPANYVRIYEDVVNTKSNVDNSKPSKARALYDFEGKDDGDLSFKAGDFIDVTSKDDEWWEGTLNGKTGVFPAIFVEEMEDDASDTASIASNSSGGKQPAFTSIFTQPSTSTINSSSGSISRSKSSKKKSDKDSTSSRDSNRLSILPTTFVPPTTFTSNNNGSTNSKVLALYDYTAQCEGELTFKKGEYIEVTNKNIGSDAWWEGKTLSTGMTGQFPKAYVKEIEQQQQQQPPPSLSPRVARVEALYDYVGQYSGELTIKKGDIIEITNRNPEGDSGWMEGRIGNKQGQFPASYVRDI